MRVLFVSGELIAGSLAYKLQEEGCDVKLYIEDKSRRDCFTNIVPKIKNWKKELKWVGKDGLIIFDDVIFGKEQDKLREEGYLVVGGSAGGDKLEKDREYGQKICKKYGLTGVLDIINFHCVDDAVEYIKMHPDYWVVKQNCHLGVFNYIGQLPDGSDVVEVLNNYHNNGFHRFFSISLQKRASGIEIGVGRYFNGKDWVGPIEFNIEHKRFFNNNIGPLTPEMGTVMWYNNDENNKLYKETLEKIKPFLEEIKFKGDVDINCIVDKDSCHPLELTTRFGSPAINLQMEIHKTPWKNFLLSLAKGEKIDVEYKTGYGIVVCLVIPPFPYLSYSSEYKKYYLKDTKISFKGNLNIDERKRIYFEEVSMGVPGDFNSLKITGNNGAILFITGFDETINGAIERAYDLAEKTVIPHVMYRTDIGHKFSQQDYHILKKWGWI